MVVADEPDLKTMNLSVPPLVKAAYEQAVEPEELGPKEKWIAASAALLMMVSAPEETRRRFVEAVRAAGKSKEKIKRLIEAVRTEPVPGRIQHVKANDLTPTVTLPNQQKGSGGKVARKSSKQD